MLKWHAHTHAQHRQAHTRTLAHAYRHTHRQTKHSHTDSHTEHGLKLASVPTTCPCGYYCQRASCCCVCVCVCSGCLCVCVACSCGACCGVRRFMAMKLLSGSMTLMRANTKRTQKIQREGGRQKHTYTHALTDRLTPHTYTHTHTYYIQRGWITQQLENCLATKLDTFLKVLYFIIGVVSRGIWESCSLAEDCKNA